MDSLGIYWNPPVKYQWKHASPKMPSDLRIYEAHGTQMTRLIPQLAFPVRILVFAHSKNSPPTSSRALNHLDTIAFN